jgi:hypothetical protein
MQIKRISFVAMIGAVMSLASCSENDDPQLPSSNTEVSETEMKVSGTWKSGTEINLDRHLVVPEGESLTIEPGVKLIVSSAGVGINHTPIEIIVKGNLYVLGSEQQPVLFTVEESKRTAANTFAGLWGGIVATETCQEMVIDHAVIEYTGGQVIEGSPSATAGIYTAGDDAYPHITTTNINGKYVITNSIIRNGWSDGIYLMGGSAIISGNIFAANGYSGAEAVNIKAGVKVDIARNVMFSPNTNGLKLSSSGQSETRGQAIANAYNNTIINAGWRRDGEKGGCVYVEKNCLANVVNNLMVNCKFRAMTPNYKNPNASDAGFDDKSVIDYNMYVSGVQKSSIVYPEESNVAYSYEGYNYKHKSYNPSVDTHSVIATVDNLVNPAFVNFDINAVSLTDYVYDSVWDFHLSADSPALSSTSAAVSPCFAAGFEINGKLYQSPALEPHYGAFGVK